MAAIASMSVKMNLSFLNIWFYLPGFDTPILGQGRPALKDTKRAKALFH
jgi:hypothetical protein